MNDIVDNPNKEAPAANIYPVLSLRDVVVYPHMVIPLFVGRKFSVKALEKAMNGNKDILLVAQKYDTEDEPGDEDLYQFGTLAKILQLLRLPDGTIKVLVEGIRRFRVSSFIRTDGMLQAEIELVLETETDSRKGSALSRIILDKIDGYAKLNKKFPLEVVTSLKSIDSISRLADSVATHMQVSIKEKQNILEIIDPLSRLEHLIRLVDNEIDLIKVEKRLRGRVKNQMEKSQREYYLNEQMKAIQKELGDMDEVPDEIEELSKKINEIGLSKAVKKRTLSELGKLKMMSPMAAEATVVRNYIDWIVSVPWRASSKLGQDIKKAEQVLEDGHYGLDKVKERILEYLAVQQRVKKMKGPILCLVGPPGVGKTSLGRSIAQATSREFIRVSLGGVRDGAEIRGHRRTYIGAMPGKIIQSMAKVGKRNPLFLLDEIDKMAMDYRGDPASALLEVLDPEQNHAFNDHYLEVDYDLSEVMFVTTANSLNILPPLLDRMEVIRLSGYTEDEKIHIATRYLVPKQREYNGLKEKEIDINKNTVRDIVRYYTCEAGVRNLEREIAKLCRKTTRKLVAKKEETQPKCFKITPSKLEGLLGVRQFRFGKAKEEDRIGQVTGLAWTEVGGDLLTIEAAAVDGKGKVIRTGRLGNIMQESIEAALTVVRSRGRVLGLTVDFYKLYDFHIHVPEGATPKDGPSAGVAMCTALVSSLARIPVKSNVAMTGEITLRGEILPIGGLKEKLLAALRGGIEVVIIPQDNEKALIEIPSNIKQKLTIKPMRWIDEVLEVALQHMPEPLEGENDEAKPTAKPAKGAKSQGKLPRPQIN